VPVTVMVVCYVGIVVSVRRQAGELRDIQSSRDQRQNHGHLRLVQLRTGLIITCTRQRHQQRSRAGLCRKSRPLTASEMTYIVSSGALNSTPTNLGHFKRSPNYAEPYSLVPEAHQQVPAVRCMDDEPEPEPETTGLGLAKMVSRLHRRLSTTFQSVSGLIPPKMSTRSAASLFLGRAVLISRRNRTMHFWSGSWAITPSRIHPQAGTCT